MNRCPPPIHRGRRFVLIITLFGAALAVGGAFAARHFVIRPDEKPAAPAAALEIDPRDLDFGEVWETESFAKTVRVWNRSSQPVRVTPLNPSCGCATSDAKPVAIAPDESAEVRFTIDLRGECRGNVPGETRSVTLPLGVAVDPPNPDAKVQWQLKGRVRPVLSVPVRTVDLGKLPAARLPEPRVIPLRAWVPLAQLNATVEENGFTAQLRASAEPQKWELVVTRLSGLPPSRYAGAVRLTMTSAAGEALPPIKLPVVFDLLGDVQADTPVLALGSGRVGESVEGKITLHSLSGRPFTIERWVHDPAAPFDITKPTTGGSLQSLTIRSTIRAAGDSTASVRFIGIDADGKPFDLAIEIRCYGLTHN